MAKLKNKAAQERRERELVARKEIIHKIANMEQVYGVAAVSGAFARHTAVRRKKRQLAAAQQQITDEIRKLEG